MMGICKPAVNQEGGTRMTIAPNSLLQGHCHCGQIQLTLPTLPTEAVRCNCSICQRTGAVWAYFPLQQVQITGHPEHTEQYIQGDKTLTLIRCKHCGIVTHWLPLQPEQTPRHGVNLNNFPSALLQQLRLRHFDGADSWQYLD